MLGLGIIAGVLVCKLASKVLNKFQSKYPNTNNSKPIPQP